MQTDEKAALETGRTKAPTEYTTAMGVKLKLQRISGFIIEEARNKLKMPQPPVIHIEAQGPEHPAYDEENPADPDYIEAVAEYNNKVANVVARCYYVLGTSILELPEGIVGPESNEWVEQLHALEIGDFNEIPDDPKSKVRYYYWLKYWGASESDAQQIIEGIMRIGGGGVLEAKVAEALDTFHGKSQRNTDSGVPSSE